MAEAKGYDWRRLLYIAIPINILTVIGIILITGEVIPPLVVSVVLWIVGLALLGRYQKVALGILLVSTLFHVLPSVMFSGESLVHPESMADFVFAILTFIWGPIALVAIVKGFRSLDRSEELAPRLFQIGIGLTVVLTLFSVIMSVREKGDESQAGDVQLKAEDIEWVPEEIQAEAGEIAVFIDNADLFRHTFAVEELDVEVEIPGSKGARATFQAESGEYDFKCTVPGHEQMEGTLVVE